MARASSWLRVLPRRGGRTRRKRRGRAQGRSELTRAYDALTPTATVERNLNVGERRLRPARSVRFVRVAHDSKGRRRAKMPRRRGESLQNRHNGRRLDVLRISDHTFPIVCLQCVGRATQSDIDAVHPVYVRAYARREPLIAISDARLATHDANQRRLFAEWSKVTFELDRGCTLVTIVILDNPLLRGALIAMNWLTPPAIPQTAAADTAGAVEAAQQVARARGLTVPPETWRDVSWWLESGHVQSKAR